MALQDQITTSAPTQDFIVLAGQPSPGVAVVKGAGTPRNWDIRQGYGLTGATTVFTGQGLAKFDVDIYLFEDAHWTAWEAFAQACLANPPLGARPTSMAIQHPQLNKTPLSIKQVVVTDVTQFEQDPDGGGLWACTISFLEYRKPRPALVKPLEGPPGAPTAVRPPANPEEQMIAQLQAQIAAAQ